MQANPTGIAAALKRNRLQQKEIAVAVGVSRGTVFSWVHGHKVPTWTHLVRLVEHLRKFEPGITERQLVPVSGVMPDPANPSPDSEKVA